jgi:hypothetical protein
LTTLDVLGHHRAVGRAAIVRCAGRVQGAFRQRGREAAAKPRSYFRSSHLDADSLDDAVMPAVDYRLPGGLACEELGTTLAIALASGKAAGLELTIYNPDLDPDGSAGLRLTDTLVGALRTGGSRS